MNDLKTLETENRELKQRFENLASELEDTRRQIQSNMTVKVTLDSQITGVLGHLGCGAITIDREGDLTQINHAAADMLSCNIDEMLGSPCQDLLGDPAIHLIRAIETGREIHSLEVTLKDLSGRSVPVRLSTACLTDSSGDIWGAAATLEDLSRLHELSEQASRVSTLTALGEMSATIAHEIRNPLGGIGGFAGLLERDMNDDDPNRRYVKKIIEGISSLNRMVTSLLNYTRPLQINMRKVDTVEIVEDALGFFEIDAGTHLDAIDIERNFPEAPLASRADPEQIQQIVLNLLHNAVQAMSDSGKLTVDLRTVDTRENDRTHLNKPCVALAVSDTGHGMSDDVKSKLFMPFFTTKVDGNGLGLATAKKVIEAHGGDLLVESEPGQGTTFMLYIPI